MENKKLDFSLIEEPVSSLPKRGGNYISEDSIRQKQEEDQNEIDRLRRKIESLKERSYSKSERDDNHPFHWGEGSCR